MSLERLGNNIDITDRKKVVTYVCNFLSVALFIKDLGRTI